MGSEKEILNRSLELQSKSIDLSKVTLRQMKSDNKKIWKENKKLVDISVTFIQLKQNQMLIVKRNINI